MKLLLILLEVLMAWCLLKTNVLFSEATKCTVLVQCHNDCIPLGKCLAR